MEKSNLLYPIVIADQRQSMKNLGDKIIAGIDKASYLIPIITKNSLKNQWVNQEIGFAKSREIENRLIIIPIIEESLLSNKLLKGFIHDQLDLPYNYKSSDNPKSERHNFRKCYNLLINDLEFQLLKVSEQLIKFKGSGKLYLQVDNLLRQFPDRDTRELFGYTRKDIKELDVTEKANYKLGTIIPSIKHVEIFIYKNRYYALFDSEFKEILNKATLNRIKELNKHTPKKIESIGNGIIIGKPLADYNKLDI